MESNLKGTAKVAGVELTICNCRLAPKAQSLISILSQHGVRFLDPRPANPDRIDSNPQREIEMDGSIIVPLTITHSLLGRDCKYFSVGWKTPVARLAFIADTRTLVITQSNAKDSETLQELVDGQVTLARILAEALGATYGWIDRTTEKSLPETAKRFNQVKNWFFANIFGPDLVASSPKFFFEQMPAYAKTALKDGGVLIQSSATFTEWNNKPALALINYLKQQAPNMGVFKD